MLAGAASLSLQTRTQANNEANNQANDAATAQIAYPAATLVHGDQRPLILQELAVGSSMVFHYPFSTTPCFLIRLRPGSSGQATLTDNAGQQYTWAGGAGPDQSLVAFSAICSHKMSHPSKPISHLNYRTDTKSIVDTDGDKRTLDQMIMCCSEHSVYDPTEGARVISGPASQPLTAINLEVDAEGQISATGCHGGDMFEAFLTKFGFRLALEHGVSDVRTPAGPTSIAVAAQDFSRQQIRC